MEERNYTEKELIQKGIGSEQAKDIVNHQSISMCNFFTLYNHSAGASVSDIQIKAHLPEEAKKRLVWMEEHLTFPYVGTKEKHADGVATFFNWKRGKQKQI